MSDKRLSVDASTDVSADLKAEAAEPASQAAFGGRLAGDLEADAQCSGCGYPLRGLVAGDQCPECGLPVAASVRGDGWEHAPAAWVKRLRAGAKALRRGVMCLPLLVYPAVPFLVFGAYAFTAAHPDDDQKWMKWNKRAMARWFVVPGGIAVVLFALVSAAALTGRFLGSGAFRQWGGDLMYRRLGVWSVVFDVWFLASHLALAMGLILLGDYIRTLADKVPDDVLAAASVRFGTATSRLLIGLAVLSVGYLTGLSWVPGNTMTVLYFVGGATALALLTLLLAWWWRMQVWSGVLCARLRPRKAA